MSYKLDPRIVSKLRAFAHRRRNLIIVRGIAAALAMLLATMLIVAAVDYLFVLPDEVRWGMSAVAYLAVIIAEWRTCLRVLAHTPNPRAMARLLEHAEPRLREDLISAVELGTGDDGRVLDSPQFRELVQQDVAARMEGMEMERILPVNLVRRYLVIASVIMIAVIAGFIATGSQLTTLMLRALLPGADFARVSKTQVEILGPNPAEMLVPFGDAVPLLVKISGAPAREAWLETFTEAEGRQKVKLSALGGDQFSGAIQVGRADLRYRVRAGDAITKKYLLDAEPRPHVVRFTKTYTPPEYLKSQPRTVSEESGDLIALEGTEVDLALETNQPIKEAELRVEQGAKGAVVFPLTSTSDGKLTGKIPLTASGTYRVHLVGAATGFENKFSPEYELRAEPDLLPQVEINQPKQDLILPANDLLELAGHAADDQGIARVEQHIRVNEGAWKKVPLLGESGRKATIARRWDLYEEGAKAGDLIATKLVAIDLKGNRGESRVLQITITSAGVEMKRLESLNALAELEESLKLWRQAIEALAKASSDARQRFERASEQDPERTTAVAALTAAQVEFDRQHTETVSVLASALRAAQPGHQSADLVLLGRLLSKTDAGTARAAKISGSIVTSNPAAAYARDLMRDADDAANRAAQRSRTIEESFRTVLSSEEADLLAENAQIVSREQKRLAELAKSSGNEAAMWTQLGGRIRVVLSETKSLEDILTRLGDRPGGGADRAKQLAKELKKQRETVDKAIAERGMTKELRDPTLALADVVSRTEKSALDLRQEYERKPIQAVHDMRQEVGPNWSNFEKLLAELDAAQSNNALPEETRSALKEGRWAARRDAFKATGDLEEVRPMSDPPYVADVRAVTLAIDTLQTLSATMPPQTLREKLTTLDRSFRLLEASHDLQEIQSGLGVIAVGERWQVATPKARTVAPRDWGWIQARFHESPEDLGKLDLKDELVRKAIGGAQGIFWEAMKQAAFRDLDREMGERKRPEHVAVTMRGQAESLAGEVKRAIDLLRPHVDAARQKIAELTPKLSEFALALAKETEKLKAETQKQEEQAKEKPPEEARADAGKTLAEQQKLNEKVDTLKDLLRADANQQDVLEAQQRERARDADDALAMLKEPPPKAENALKDATESQAPTAQEQALAQAAEQQQKLEQALNQIAKHFDALEQGSDPAETRTAMRDAENELGIKDALDQQYAKAQQLAQMAQASPEELLKQLEQALPQNPQMQQELSSISQNTLNEAQQKLTKASQRESQTAENVAQLAKQEEKGIAPQNAQQAAASAEQAARMAAGAAKSSKEASRAAEQAAKQAQNQPAAQQANRAAELAKTASQAAEQAAQAAHQMSERTDPQQIAQAADATMARAADAARNAEQAAEQAAQAQKTSQQEAGKGNQPENNQQTADRSADAAQKAQQAAEAARDAVALAREAAALAQMPQAQMAQNGASPQPNQPQPQPQPSSPGEPQPGAPAAPAEAQAQAPQNPLLAQAARQQQPIGQAAAEAGADVSRAGRHEERLQNSQTGERLQQLGAEISETAMNEVPAAKSALEQGPNAAQAQQPLNAAAQELAAEAGQLQQAAQGGSPQIPSPGEAQPAQGQSAAQAAQAGQPPQNGQQPANAPATAQAQGQPAQGQPQQGQQPGQMAQAGQPGQQGQLGAQGQPAPSGQAAAQAGQPQNATASAAPATPQEQVWMARTLDALDAALHSPANAGGEEPKPGEQGAPQNAQNGQNPQGQPQQGQGKPQGQGQPGQQQPGQGMAQAKSAMQQAAQAAQQAMQQARSQGKMQPSQGEPPVGGDEEKSLAGAQAQMGDKAYGAVPDASKLKRGDWGKLPKQMAEQLTRGQGETVAAEYRQQVETYYRVIAEKAKKR